MAADEEDEFVWSRALLAVISVGFIAVAGMAFVASALAIDPEERVPRVAILAPAGIAACGLALAAIGGRVARVVSGVLGLLVVAGAVWMLADAGPSAWFSNRFAVVLFLGVLGVAVVGAAAVGVAVREEVSSGRDTIRQPAAGTGQPHRSRFTHRLTLVLSWLIVAALMMIGVGVGWWWVRTTVIAPSCGAVADTQLHAAMEQMSGQIPGLRFTHVETDCAVGEVFAVWEHPDSHQLLTSARSAGCTVNESALSGEDGDLLTCNTAGRRVVFMIETAGSIPMGGSMTMIQ